MLWLLNSMGPTIVEGFLFLNSVKEIWDAFAEIYGQGAKLSESIHSLIGDNQRQAIVQQLSKPNRNDIFLAILAHWMLYYLKGRNTMIGNERKDQ